MVDQNNKLKIFIEINNILSSKNHILTHSQKLYINPLRTKYFLFSEVLIVYSAPIDVVLEWCHDTNFKRRLDASK